MATREEKRAKFEELAEKRVIETIRRIRLIGNLANRSNYDYAERHVKQIMSTLNSEVKALRSRFDDGGGDDDIHFEFKE